MDDLDTLKPIHVVIVGHVDHGKSTFIGRFLYDTNNLTTDRLRELEATAKEKGTKLEFAHVMDQFKEERDQNITIDTAQTFFQIDQQPYVFIDAPGHKEYLKNMITGATQASNAFLLLDITEGIQEQTDKHLRILSLLGIERLAILVNKMDAVHYEESTFNAAKFKIEELLKVRGVRADKIIPISAREGDNVAQKTDKMPWYDGPTALEFITSLKPTEAHDSKAQECVFPIQMIYSLKGDSFVMGRIEKGSLKVGETVSLFGSDEKVKINKILKYKQKLKEAQAGDSVALVLDKNHNLKRGQVLYKKEKPVHTTDHFVAQLFWASPESLRQEANLNLECRTQSVTCSVEKIWDELDESSKSELKQGDIGLVQFSVNSPLFLENQGPGDPFSRLVFHKNGNVVGCAVVQKVGVS